MIRHASLKLRISRRDLTGMLIGAAMPLCANAAAAEAAPGWEPAAGTQRLALQYSDADGVQGGIGNFAGAPLLINFWATWCTPCLVELPALDRLARNPARGPLAIVALSLDQRGIAPVLEVFRRAKIRNLQPIVDSAGSSMAGLDLPALPFTLLVSRDGLILAKRRGRVAWDSPVELLALRNVLTRFGLTPARATSSATSKWSEHA